MDLGELADYNGPQHAKHALLTEPERYGGIESGMTWLGVAGLQDPPRPEVAGAIDRCAQAGIRVRHHGLVTTPVYSSSKHLMQLE